MKFKRPQGARWGVKALAESDELQIVMYDVIGEDWWGDGTSSKAVLAALKAAPDVGTIRVSINSPGGDVFEGLAIHTALRKHAAKVIVEVDALAASIASVIAMAGDEVHMAAGAMLMIHDPWTMTIGDAAEHTRVSEMLGKVRDSILDVYAGRSVLNRDDLSQKMLDETWLTADEAKAAGFATHVSTDAKPEAQALAQAFPILSRQPSQGIAAAINSPPAPSEGLNGELMTTKLLIKLGVEDEAQALAAIDASTGFINAVKSATGAADFSAALDRLGNLNVLAQVEDVAGAKGDELVGKIAALKDSAEKLPEALAQIAENKAKAEADKRSALIDNALEKGKVVKARADWLREQPIATVESFLAVAGDGVPGSNGTAQASAPPDAVHMTDQDRKLAKGFGMTDEQWIAAKREADGQPPIVVDDTDDGEA